ncbi:hypothetical protein VNO77_08787 [Canavalia gladiata]|uniref:Uncharacterized protein n=1 Tax=Canavalia gladiata TaxID=3824 RepID=A0AAN9QX51_CANGL
MNLAKTHTVAKISRKAIPANHVLDASKKDATTESIKVGLADKHVKARVLAGNSTVHEEYSRTTPSCKAIDVEFTTLQPTRITLGLSA